MKIIIATMTLILLSTPLMAEEECIFDQEEQKEKYLELEKKYPGSRYVEKEYELIIPRNDHQIILKRGGCVHFGITIELHLPETNEFRNEKAFFEKIIKMIEEFGGEMINLEVLRKKIAEKKWRDFSGDGGFYYFVNYEGLTAFEAYSRDEAGMTIIGVSYYI